MVKSVDYSFPKVYPNTEPLFSLEVTKLNDIWNACCSTFEQNAKLEMAYKNEDACIEGEIAGSTCGIVCGTACLVGGISLQLPLALLAGVGSIAAGIWGWKHIVDVKDQLNRFMDCRVHSYQTVEKIERCVKLMNQVGELFLAWENAKQSPSDERLNALFKSFNRVQKAEIGLLKDAIDPVLPFFLMDNIAALASSDSKTIQAWKDFTAGKNSNPPEFKYLKATKSAYFNYIIKRMEKSELQVESKITELKNYINQQIISLPAF